MMIKIKLASAVILVAFAATAQYRHGGGGGTAPLPPAPRGGPIGPVGFGFGNVVFPGTGIPSAASGHAASLGATVRGVYPAANPNVGAGGWPRGGGGGRAGGGYYYGRGNGGYFYGGRGGATTPIVVPVPVYVGGYGYDFGYAGSAGYASAQPVTIVNNPPEQPAAAVIINQNYTPERPQPIMRDYSTAPLPEPGGGGGGGLSSYQAPVPSNPEPAPAPATRKPAVANNNDDTPTVYLIAFRDGTVYSAYAYWLEGDTLHYITTKHSHNRASLSLIDEALSAQLNLERSVDWKLKSPSR